MSSVFQIHFVHFKWKENVLWWLIFYIKQYKLPIQKLSCLFFHQCCQVRVSWGFLSVWTQSPTDWKQFSLKSWPILVLDLLFQIIPVFRHAHWTGDTDLASWILQMSSWNMSVLCSAWTWNTKRDLRFWPTTDHYSLLRCYICPCVHIIVL